MCVAAGAAVPSRGDGLGGGGGRQRGCSRRGARHLPSQASAGLSAPVAVR